MSSFSEDEALQNFFNTSFLRFGQMMNGRSYFWINGKYSEDSSFAIQANDIRERIIFVIFIITSITSEILRIMGCRIIPFVNLFGPYKTMKKYALRLKNI